jgi:hypothetical protein
MAPEPVRLLVLPQLAFGHQISPDFDSRNNDVSSQMGSLGSVLYVVYLSFHVAFFLLNYLCHAVS